MKLTADDFEAWRHSPLSELILSKFLTAEMQKTRAGHEGASWQGPLADSDHAAYRERYETLEWLKNLTFEEVDEWLKSAM